MPLNGVFFKDTDGSVPLLEWLDGEVAKRDARIAAKCYKFIEMLAELGRLLPTKYAKLLRDGIWELRIRYGSVNYRILYFFGKTGVVVLSHGLTKEDVVLSREIDLAVERKRLFEKKPEEHIYVTARSGNNK